MVIPASLLLFSSSALAQLVHPRNIDCQSSSIGASPSSQIVTPSISTTSPQTNVTNSNNTVMRWLPDTETVRGVNLGSQFIIEPWMAYDEFNSMGCGGLQDETSCVSKLGQETADTVFAKHWDTWITQDDITKIAGLGLNVIRIQVGFWIREDLAQQSEHFPRGGLFYLDRLAGWAADAGLHVIIDLHGAPGSQAVEQSFTGDMTASPGFYNLYNYERAAQFLEWMTNRIHTQDEYRTTGVFEVLNEPVNAWNFPQQAADMIENYYPLAYSRIRAAEEQLGVQVEDQLKIQYMDKDWGSGDPTASLPDSVTNVIFDGHRYFAYGDGAPMTKEDALSDARKSNYGGNSTIAGEWSLALKDGVADLVNDKGWYTTFWQAQVQAYEQAGGWIFWTWKCNWIGGKDDWPWCYESAVDNGVISNV